MLSNSKMHTHIVSHMGTCTKTHTDLCTYKHNIDHFLQFSHSSLRFVNNTHTHTRRCPLHGFHRAITSSSVSQSILLILLHLILMFILSWYITVEFKVWKTQKAFILSPPAADMSKFATLVGLWCDPLPVFDPIKMAVAGQSSERGLWPLANDPFEP